MRGTSMDEGRFCRPLEGDGEGGGGIAMVVAGM